MKTFLALRLVFARWVLPAVVAAGGAVSAGCATKSIQVNDVSCLEQVTDHLGLLPPEHPWFKYTTIFSSSQPAVSSQACAAGGLAVADMIQNIRTDEDRRYIVFTNNMPMVWAQMLQSNLDRLDRAEKTGEPDPEAAAAVFYMIHYMRKMDMDPKKLLQAFENREVRGLINRNISDPLKCSVKVDVTPPKKQKNEDKKEEQAPSASEDNTALARVCTYK